MCLMCRLRRPLPLGCGAGVFVECMRARGQGGGGECGRLGLLRALRRVPRHAVGVLDAVPAEQVEGASEREADPAWVGRFSRRSIVSS